MNVKILAVFLVFASAGFAIDSCPALEHNEAGFVEGYNAYSAEVFAAANIIRDRVDNPEALLAAMISQESSWRMDAVSPCASAGISQFTPGTAISMGLTVSVNTDSGSVPFTDYDGYRAYLNSNNLWQSCRMDMCGTKVSPCNSCTPQYCDLANDERFNPARAMDAMAKHLSDLLNRCGSIDGAIMAYNSGRCGQEANTGYLSKIKKYYSSWSSCLDGEQAVSESENTHFIDAAGLVSGVNDVEGPLQALENEKDVKIIMQTVPALEESIDDFMNREFEKNGLGRRHDMLIVFQADQKLMHFMGSCHSFNSAVRDSILGAGHNKEALDNGWYDQAFIQIANELYYFDMSGFAECEAPVEIEDLSCSPPEQEYEEEIIIQSEGEGDNFVDNGDLITGFAAAEASSCREVCSSTLSYIGYKVGFTDCASQCASRGCTWLDDRCFSKDEVCPIDRNIVESFRAKPVLISERLERVKDGYKGFVLKDPLCLGPNCGQYVTRAHEYIFGIGKHFITGVGGNAWNMPKNVQDRGGTVLWIDWRGGDAADLASLRPGDVIGLYYEKSAYRAGTSNGRRVGNTPDIDMSHVALYLGEKNGEHIITHLYHPPENPDDNVKAIRTESIESFLQRYGDLFKIRAIIRPDQEKLYRIKNMEGISFEKAYIAADDTLRNLVGFSFNREEYMWLTADVNGLIENVNLNRYIGKEILIPQELPEFYEYDYELLRDYEQETTEIIKSARNSDIVAFGELHYQFNDNQFVENLLPTLKNEGYSVLGVEVKQTAANILRDYLEGRISKDDVRNAAKRIGDAELIEVGVGFSLLDKAKQLGYEIVPIDSEKDYDADFEKREQEIYNNVRDITADGRKIVIIIGVAHISENLYGLLSFCMLGCRLNEAYGERFLSVDLVKKDNTLRQADINIPIVSEKR